MRIGGKLAIVILFWTASYAAFGQFIAASQPSLTVASSNLPVWDPGELLIRPVQPPAPVAPFLSSRGNRALVTADFGVRILDAFSSWMDRPSKCPYCGPEEELPQAWSNSLPTMLVYSTTVSATVDLSARFLWRRRHGRLARLALLSDIAGDGEAGVGNVRIYVRAQSYAAALRAAAASRQP